MTNKEAINILKRGYPDIYRYAASEYEDYLDCVDLYDEALALAIEALEEKPQGDYVDISKLRLMTVEECAGHTIDYALGWKACIEWIKKGGAE